MSSGQAAFVDTASRRNAEATLLKTTLLSSQLSVEGDTTGIVLNTDGRPVWVDEADVRRLFAYLRDNWFPALEANRNGKWTPMARGGD